MSTTRLNSLTISIILLVCTAIPCVALDTNPNPPKNKVNDEKKQNVEEPDEKEPTLTAEYRGGLRIKSKDGNFATRIRWRTQSRVSNTSSPDLTGEKDGINPSAGFRIKRARFKLDGHAYRPWLKYALEYGFERNVLLSLQFDIQKSEKVGVRIGQYKALYSRERSDSSGAQQFVDRSIVNSPFTVDRQSGVTVLGRLFPGSSIDSQYAAGVFTGNGRGGALDRNQTPMFIGRWQWNFLKREFGYGQSDVGRRSEPLGSFALAAATNQGAYTKFSSGGAGQLKGFSGADNPSQYKLTQWLAELAYQGHGLSIQSEYHRKQIDSQPTKTSGSESVLKGWYAQAGYFFHEFFPSFPQPLEIAIRMARVDPVKGIAIPTERELTVGANWFYNGHNNKVTMDISRLSTTLPKGSEDTGWRTRVQWDITF